MINADSGKTIWDLPISGYAAHQNAVWRGARSGAFVGMQHYRIDMQTGVLESPVSLIQNVQLRRFKDDVKEVASGYECGMSIERYNDIKVGDVIESYYVEEIRPEVE